MRINLSSNTKKFLLFWYSLAVVECVFMFCCNFFISSKDGKYGLFYRFILQVWRWWFFLGLLFFVNTWTVLTLVIRLIILGYNLVKNLAFILKTKRRRTIQGHKKHISSFIKTYSSFYTVMIWWCQLNYKLVFLNHGNVIKQIL